MELFFCRNWSERQIEKSFCNSLLQHIYQPFPYVLIRFHQDGKDICVLILKCIFLFEQERCFSDLAKLQRCEGLAFVVRPPFLWSSCPLVGSACCAGRWLIHFRSTSGSRSPFRPTTCHGCPQQNGVLQPEARFFLWMFQGFFLNVVLWYFIVFMLTGCLWCSTSQDFCFEVRRAVNMQIQARIDIVWYCTTVFLCILFEGAWRQSVIAMRRAGGTS